MRRGTRALVLGVALPTTLLAAGWLYASLREQEVRAREQRALLSRAAEVVRGAVDESLEELRAREDARPFYLYNHFYTPEDVLALTDPVAVTPLAGDPDDQRVVGYFQIDPGGVVRTPYEPEPGASSSERARALSMLVAAEPFAPVRALASAPVPPVAPTRGQDDEGAVTVSLNTRANALYEDLKQAESDDTRKIAMLGTKKAPKTSRKNVEWTESQKAIALPSQNAAPTGYGTGEGYGTGKPSPKKKAAPQQALAPPVELAPTTLQAAGGAGSDVDDVTAPPQQATAVSAPDRIASAGRRPSSGRERPPGPDVDVAYTPMIFQRAGDDFVLSRVVSHDGVSSVQGLLLDRAYVTTTWLPRLVERHAVAVARPAVLVPGAAGDCALRAPASSVLPDVELCFPPAALSGAASSRAGFYLECGALAALLIAVGFALVTVDRAQTKADELSKQKSAFITAVSHELRTPLTTLRMHAELLRDGLVSDAKKHRFHADMVNEAVRLSRLVENVLEVSRLEEGRRPLRLQRIDVAGHVAAVVRAQAPFVEARGFQVQVDASAGPLEADLDAQAVEQIVVNLVDNAVKYAADGEPKLVEVVVAVDDAANQVAIHVLDRGPGVPAAEREKVFERFHRVAFPGKEHVVGTGLGLSLVRELARAHGGEARVLQRDGGGADVVVTLPLA